MAECDGCQWFVRAERQFVPDQIGSCHRRAPILGALPWGLGHWPAVFPDDWCGDFEAIVREVRTDPPAMTTDLPPNVRTESKTAE